jgi:5-methylcytosine-specific restriction endonuclease McrA
MAQTCNKCGKRSYQSLCFRHKPRGKIKRVSDKKALRNNLLRKKWYKTNPPNQFERWECYLQISNCCPVSLTKGMMTLEHVESKVRSPHRVYDVTNIRPACSWCNAIKGSKSLEELSIVYPQLNKYL